MGAATSRLGRIFSHALQVTSLSTAFNLALVADGIRPSFHVSPPELAATQKVIDLYAAKLLSLKGDGLVVGKHDASGWPHPTPVPAVPSSADSTLFYHMDAFILCHDSKTKQDTSAVFYSFEAPEPLSHTSQGALYHSMLKAYTLARRLSSNADDGVILRVDLAYHKVLPPTMVHTLVTTGTTADLDPLLTYLRKNGFGPVADTLQANPRLLTSEAFRRGVLAPLFTFEQSGMLSTFTRASGGKGGDGTSTQQQELQAQTQTWSQALLSQALPSRA